MVHRAIAARLFFSLNDDDDEKRNFAHYERKINSFSFSLVIYISNSLFTDITLLASVFILSLLT